MILVGINITLTLTTTQAKAINADFGRQALAWLVASVYIGNHVHPASDISKGEADATINKGFILADRVMKLRGL